MRYLPDISWAAPRGAERSSAPTVSREAQNAGARKTEGRLRFARAGDRVPVVYGTRTVPGLPITAAVYQGKWLLLYAFAAGECDAVEQVFIDNAALPAGVTATVYLGTAGQTADPAFVAAWAASGQTYSYALANVCYAVLSVPPGLSSGAPAVTARIRGRKLYDHRTGLTVHSDCPALALADFASSTLYGMGIDVDADSVDDVADHNDALLGEAPNQEKRRTLALALDNGLSGDAWLEVLRGYAGCMLDTSVSPLRLIADATTASSFSFGPANVIRGSVKGRRRFAREKPTVVRVEYDDQSLSPPARRTAIAQLDGVSTGAVSWREQTIEMPGIPKYSEALRAGKQRLLTLNLCDAEVEWRSNDPAIAVTVGDVVLFSWPRWGWVDKAVRVTAANPVAPGRWSFHGVEYDPAVYPLDVTAGPSTPDTTLPSPTTPAAPASITVTEELFEPANRIVVSRLRASWPAVDLPWAHHYRCEFWRGSVLASQSVTDGLEAVSDQVDEGVMYTVRVATVVPFVGAASAWRSTTATPLGKDLPPTNVAYLDGLEVGGELRLNWPAAIDIDFEGYEVRWGAVAVAWEDATVLDRLNALRLVSKEIPAGTWDFLVCAYDSRRDEQGLPNYSPTPARKTITVTLDAAAFLVDRFDFTTPTLVGMAEYRLAPDDGKRWFITEDGATVASKFTGDLSAYTEPMASYHAAQTSRLTTDSADFGQVLAGNWQGTASNADAISGAIADFIELSDTLAAWTSTAGLVVKASGRFSRLKFEGSGADTIRVALPDLSVRLDAVPRTEVGVATSLSSGPVTVTLEQVFTAFKGRPKITPTGNAPRSYTVDNLVVGSPTSFDVYIWNSADALVVNEFGYEANGV